MCLCQASTVNGSFCPEDPLRHGVVGHIQNCGSLLIKLTRVVRRKKGSVATASSSPSSSSSSSSSIADGGHAVAVTSTSPNSMDIVIDVSGNGNQEPDDEEEVSMKAEALGFVGKKYVFRTPCDYQVRVYLFFLCTHIHAQTRDMYIHICIYA
jgi:Tau95 Triple barrel domain